MVRQVIFELNCHGLFPRHARMLTDLAPVSLTAAHSIGSGRQSGTSGDDALLRDEAPHHTPPEVPGPSLFAYPRRVELVEQESPGVAKSKQLFHVGILK